MAKIYLMEGAFDLLAGLKPPFSAGRWFPPDNCQIFGKGHASGISYPVG